MIPLNAPSLGPLEEQYVLDALKSGWVTTGQYVGKFERGLSVLTGRKYVVACSSGTAALYLAIKALAPKAPVLVPAYTCDAVCNAALIATGVQPNVVDSEAATFGLSSFEVTMAGVVGAVILAHCYGVPARDTFSILEACMVRGIPMIEDASEAHGARYEDGRPVGSVGRVSIMSFRGEKTISGGQLGAVLTDDADIARLVKLWSHNGLPSGQVRYWAVEPGLNMQPAHLNAALACAQLERLTELVQKRNVVHDRWCQLFYAKRQRAWLFQDPGVHKPAWWLTAIRVDEFTKMLPQDLGTALAERGIETRPGFYPLSFYPHIASRGPVPVAEKLLRTLLILPSGPDITEDQQEEVMTAIGRITGAWS